MYPRCTPRHFSLLVGVLLPISPFQQLWLMYRWGTPHHSSPSRRQLSAYCCVPVASVDTSTYSKCKNLFLRCTPQQFFLPAAVQHSLSAVVCLFLLDSSFGQCITVHTSAVFSSLSAALQHSLSAFLAYFFSSSSG